MRVRSTGLPATVTSRASGSITRSPKQRSAAAAGVAGPGDRDRRKSTRTRATSSRAENGLVT